MEIYLFLKQRKNGLMNLKTNKIMKNLEKLENQMKGFILGFFIGGLVVIIIQQFLIKI